MTLTVRTASSTDRVLLTHLVELYLHDFSEFDGRDVCADGSYHYQWLESYWRDKDRQAYLFEVDDHPAGFALVRLADAAEVAEFFVLRKYRRSGVGSTAARDVIGRHPGRWSIQQLGTNTSATAFWRRAIPVTFLEKSLEDGRLQQLFEVADHSNQ